MTQQDKREMFRHNLHMAVLNAHKHGMSRHHIREALTDETSAIADTDDPAMREETTSEHVARDMREGRFPQRSEPRQVTEPSEEQPMTARRTIFPTKDDPALTATIQRAVDAFNAMTPEQKREHRAMQRKSWVVGETMLSHPEMTRAEAEMLVAALMTDPPKEK